MPVRVLRCVVTEMYETRFARRTAHVASPPWLCVAGGSRRVLCCAALRWVSCPVLSHVAPAMIDATTVQSIPAYIPRCEQHAGLTTNEGARWGGMQAGDGGARVPRCAGQVQQQRHGAQGDLVAFQDSGPGYGDGWTRRLASMMAAVCVNRGCWPFAFSLACRGLGAHILLLLVRSVLHCMHHSLIAGRATRCRPSRSLCSRSLAQAACISHRPSAMHQPSAAAPLQAVSSRRVWFAPI